MLLPFKPSVWVAGRRNMTLDADDDPAAWSERPFWVRITSRTRQRIRSANTAGDGERCRQCHFPWFLHPRRYDPEEDEMVRFCTEYPAEPVQSIEGCIAP